MENYLINKNEMLSFLRYEILYKWKSSIEKNPKNKDFGYYLLHETPYQPEHEFIQSFCETKEEHVDPFLTGVYEHILPADVARYQLKTLYSPFKNKEEN